MGRLTGMRSLAIAEAMKNVGRKATIHMANDVPRARVDLIEAHGVDVVIYGEEAREAEKKARAAAASEGKVHASPYNDPAVVGGLGTCGLEIARQVPSIDTLIAACGGGGLVAGSAGYLKSCDLAIETIAVSPENSPVMYESLRQGKMLEVETFTTLADTCAGGVELDTIRVLFEEHRIVAEGSAALSVAYLLEHPGRFKGRTVVPIVCGGNIGTELFESIITRPR